MVASPSVLVINSGSSSVKFAAFDLFRNEPQRIFSGSLQRIGLETGRFVVKNREGQLLVEERAELPNHIVALDLLLAWIEEQASESSLIAVGHRVVHGGPECDCPLRVTPALEARLKRLIPLAPLHLPHNLAGITAIRLRRPDLKQIACFDTAFHRRLPRVAQLTALPRRFQDDGIRRYGFHGLSYEYVVEEIRRNDGTQAASGRIIAAHLGNGASMAAIRNARSVETSMGFSTLAGLPMGTRPGDLDAGILLHLLIERGMSPQELQRMLYEQSGLLGISGLSRDVSDLLAHPEKQEAVEAIDYFCHHARRHLAGLTASLGGVDRVIFTGGIGANSPEIRARICEGLGHLGLAVDGARNEAQEHVISAPTSQVRIETFPTDEELMIARHTSNVLRASHQPGEAYVYGQVS